MVAVAGGLLAGLATAYAVGHRLDEQGTERRARFRRSSPRPRRAAPRLRSWMTVASGRCAPDGSAHTGQTKVEPGTRAGSWLTVWIGRRGRLVSMPLTPGKAAFQATWAGALVGVGTAGAVIGAPKSRVPALSGDAAAVGRRVGAHRHPLGPEDQLKLCEELLPHGLGQGQAKPQVITKGDAGAARGVAVPLERCGDAFSGMPGGCAGFLPERVEECPGGASSAVRPGGSAARRSAVDTCSRHCGASECT